MYVSTEIGRTRLNCLLRERRNLKPGRELGCVHKKGASICSIRQPETASGEHRPFAVQRANARLCSVVKLYWSRKKISHEI